MTDRPTSSGVWTREWRIYRVFVGTSGKWHAVHINRDGQEDLPLYVDALPTGNWQKLGATAGEARERFRRWLDGEVEFDDGPELIGEIADKAAELFAGVQEREQEPGVDQLYRHAIKCVDRVFQECKENPKPILPDFLGLGADKFEGVVKLAEKYRESESQITTLKKTIAELKRERNNFENGCCHLQDDARRLQSELTASVDHHERTRDRIDKALGEPRYDGCEIWTAFERRIAELKDLKPAPQPEVIEGRGQSSRPGVYATYYTNGQRQGVYPVYPGWKFVTGWLYRFLCELPPETIEIPKPAFVAPEKPEQVLCLFPTGTTTKSITAASSSSQAKL